MWQLFYYYGDEMFNIMTDYANVSFVFSEYKMKDSIQVKRNIEYVFSQLQLPSEDLLKEMAAEGISLSELAPTSNNLDTRDLNTSVIRSHLHTLFLNHTSLYQAISAMSIQQKLLVRDFLLNLVPMLKLPSPALLEKMEQQGVIAANPIHLVCENTEQEKLNHARVESIKDKLTQFETNTKSRSADEVKVARVKALLAKKKENTTNIEQIKKALNS